MIEIVGVAVNKTEDDPPIAGDPHRMKTGIFPAQRVQLEARNVDILDPAGFVDDGQAVFNPADLVGGEESQSSNSFRSLLLLNDLIIVVSVG